MQLRIGRVGHVFSAAHRLVGHPGKCASLHGHNYVVNVDIRGDNPHANMVMDFADIKRYLDDIVSVLDHATLLQSSDPLCPAVAADAATRVVEFSEPPTAEAICRWIWQRMSDRLSAVEGVRLHRLTVFETPAVYAEVCSDELPSDSARSPLSAQRPGGCTARFC